MNYQLLSINQKKVLDAILSEIASKGISPSIRKIQRITGIKSLRGVTLQLETLEKLGYIAREYGVRGIQINKAILQTTNKVSIPLMVSSIPAGYGSLADDFSDQKIEVSIADTKGVNNVFAVPVSGESMINAGIDDGDIAIIAPQHTAEDGDIVAALYDNGVTLKRFRIVDDIPMLVPANPKFRPILEEFVIQGKLINLIKKRPQITKIS